MIGTINRSEYVGTGLLTTYSYGFKIYAATDLHLVKRDTLGNESVMVYPTQYSVTGVGAAAGGTVVLAVALQNGYTLSIRRVRPLSQTTDIRNQASFNRETIEDTFDDLVMRAQQLQDTIDRCIRVQESLGIATYDLVLPVPEANKVLGWDAVGKTIKNIDAGLNVPATMASDALTFIAAGAGAVSRTGRSKMRERVSVTDFGAVGNDVVDDTAAIQAANDAIVAQQLELARTGIAGRSWASLPVLYFPFGKYKITAAINLGKYVKVDSDHGAIVRQATGGADIFVWADCLQNTVDGLSFSGGRRQLSFSNLNVDATNIRVRDCDFEVSTGAAIYSTGAPQISGTLHITDCRWQQCTQDLDSVFDETLIDGHSWAEIDTVIGSDNPMAANSALFVNRQGVLRFDGFVGIPNVGVDGTRKANIRWIDMRGTGVYINNSRFGGESAGIPIIYTFTALPAVYPYLGATIAITNSQISAGLAIQADRGVIVIGAGGNLPIFVKVANCYGISDSIWINNAVAALALPAYFAANPNVPFQFDFTSTKAEGMAAIDANLLPYLVRLDALKQVAAIPTVGTFVQGQILWNSNPLAGRPLGWVCTVAGTPGTWLPFGIVSSSVITAAVTPINTWIAPVLVNAWANAGGAEPLAGYMMDANGCVHLRGSLITGVIPNAMFTLPAGYRPTGTRNFPVMSANGGPVAVVGWIQITAAGVVTPIQGGVNETAIDGIIFETF